MAERLKVQRLPSSDTDTGSERGCIGTSDTCFPQVRRLIMDKYGGGTPNSVNTFSKKTSVATSRATPGSTSTISRRQPMRSAKVPATPSQVSGLNTVHNQNMQREKILDPVDVYCRVRPLENQTDESCIKIIDDKSIILSPPDNPTYWKQGIAKEQTYSFQHVFNELVDQKVVFNGIALPLVKDVLEGKNALLFAYGVTGSGKTFTMSGTQTEPGIMPRCLDIIFNSISGLQAGRYVFKPDCLNGFDTQYKAEAMLERQRELSASMPKTPRAFRNCATRPIPVETEVSHRIKDPTIIPLLNQDVAFSVFITYVEVYNNNVYDLLDESPIHFNKKALLQSKMLREDGRKNIYVHSVNEVEVESADEAYEVFNRGQRRRRMAHTALNAESSRSHSIFSVRLVQAPLDSEGEEVVGDKNLMCISQLSLVDLAGSERYGRSKATGDRLKEAGSINNSLMTLRQCLDYLRENQQSSSNKIIPYRDSKLTHFLRNYFEGEGRVRMVLCVSPRGGDYDENIHVMGFAELTQEVQVVRPQVVKLDPMTPGRRKANEMYKEARRRLVEEICISEEDLPPKSDVSLVFNLGPALPLCKMTAANEAELLLNLKRALEARVKGRRDLHSSMIDKRNSFRTHLVSMERNMETMINENDSLKTKLNMVSDDKDATENVLRTIQFEKTELELKCEEQEKQMDVLQHELDNCRMELRQREVVHLKEQERLKSDLDLQRELEEFKRERKLYKEEAKLKAEYKGKEETIEAVRKLVNPDDVPSKRNSRSRYSAAALPESFSTSSDSDIPSAVALAGSTRVPPSRVSSAPSLPFELAPQTRRGVAIHNSRRFRSQSTENEKWLEHVPGVPIKQSTVFQPILKNKKSVNKLINAGDIVAKTSKYCLQTQEQDTDGELETKLYKGDVLQTIGGGAQVVFNDVEILKQVSPTSGSSPIRKRVSTTPKTPNKYEDDPEAVTLRCTMGIGHNPTKRSRPN